MVKVIILVLVLRHSIEDRSNEASLEQAPGHNHENTIYQPGHNHENTVYQPGHNHENTVYQP